MTLRNSNARDVVEPPQVVTIQNAGGPRLEGSFCYTGWGWELNLRALTFSELLRIVRTAGEAVK